MEIKRVSFAVEADRWRTWSSPPLPSLTPGLLRVEVIADGCLLGQQTLQITAQTLFDPATRTGWMRPQQALETTLARQAEQPVDPDRRPRLIDSRDDSGDTWLTAAIRRRDSSEVLKLLNTHDMDQIPNANRLPRAEYEKYWHRANPLLLDRDGISPINLAHRPGQSDLVEALIACALSPRAPSKRRRSNRGPERAGE